MAAEGRKDSASATTTVGRNSSRYGGTGVLSGTDRGPQRTLGLNHSGARQAKKRFWPLALFVVGLVIPVYIPLGPLRLSVYRLVLLLAFMPTFVSWLAGKAGRIRLPDILLLAFCFWCSLSFITVHGLALSIEAIGILWIETMGSYLLARCYIRTADDFLRLARLLFWTIAVLLPFALVEALTGTKPLLKFFGAFLPTPESQWMPPRLGLERAQGPFEHSILFGVFCGSAVALTHLVVARNKPLLQRWSMTATVVATSFFSFSAGPLTGVGVQFALIAWNWLLRSVQARWKILWGMAAAMYAFIAIASNQSVPQFVVTRVAFNKETAYFRLLIWDYGSAAALKNPFVGVGFGEWERPDWMPPSIDMFWLIYAVRHGIPAGALLLLFFFAVVIAVGFRKGLNSRLLDYRTAYLITMAAFFVTGWATHFWNATYVLLFFLAGSGMWLLDVKPMQSAPSTAGEPQRTDGALLRPRRPL